MVYLPSDPILAKEVSLLDENSVSLGIPKSLLMECAGIQAATKIFAEYKLGATSKIVIFCGTGNNGGDGFVIARHLSSNGVNAVVILFGDPSNIRTEEAKLNWTILQNLVANVRIIKIKDSSELSSVSNELQGVAAVIDCLLGTGVKGKIREPIGSAISLINSIKAPKISIDVPSGMDPDSGAISDKAVQCDMLITFHRAKKGIINIPNLHVLSIGIPVEAQLFVGQGDLLQSIHSRPKTNTKGQYGKVLVIGGSNSYAGAPSLAAMAALEFGVDLCIVLAPHSVANVIRGFSPSLIVREGKKENLCDNDLDLAKELTQWASAILIGPGIGTAQSTMEFVEKYLQWLKTVNKPLVIDADALKIVGQLIKDKQFRLKGTQTILTPHAGELKALGFNDPLPDYNDLLRRGAALTNFQEKLGSVLLLKGVFDFIAADNHQFRVNRTGCPEMSVGGTGDVLAGLAAAFLSLGKNCYDSACCAAYLNGLLGERAKSNKGKRINASDLIAELRLYLKSLNL